MSDSVKLRFEHGIWCLVFSYLTLVASVVFGFLTFLVSGGIFLLFIISFTAFAFLLLCAIDYFKEAIATSKKEGEQKNKKRETDAR